MERKCDNVCKEECVEKDKRVCMTIPQQECKKKPQKKCEQIPRKECKEVSLETVYLFFHFGYDSFSIADPSRKMQSLIIIFY